MSPAIICKLGKVKIGVYVKGLVVKSIVTICAGLVLIEPTSDVDDMGPKPLPNATPEGYEISVYVGSTVNGSNDKIVHCLIIPKELLYNHK